MALSGASAKIAEDGGDNFSVDIITAAGCNWTVKFSAGWVAPYPLSGTGPGTVTYSVYPNFSNAPRSTELRINSQVFQIVNAAGTGTSDERFVKLLYFNFLGRRPTVDEIRYQVQNGMPQGRPNLTASFFNSTEFQWTGKYIAGLYLGLLGRDAEFRGWLYQRNALSRGLTTRTTLVQVFLDAAEYSARFGSPDNSTFVRLLYRNILLREPTQAEVDFQVAQGVLKVGRGNLAAGFLLSEEFQRLLGARMTSELLYFCLLQRDPAGSELESLLSLQKADLSLATMALQLLILPEFQAVVP